VNHKRVKHIKSLLEKHNLKPWIDDTHNRDNMLFSIAEGIRKSHFFIVFLTANFNEKIKRGHVEKEWCFRELNYAAYKLSPKNVFVVVLEEEMTDKSSWADALLFLFAGDVYFDLSTARKRGDGWDYSNTEAWPNLLTKLKEYDVKQQAIEEETRWNFHRVILYFTLCTAVCLLLYTFGIKDWNYLSPFEYRRCRIVLDSL
jgi:hypothetical protein